MNRSTATTNDAAMRNLSAQPYRKTMGLRRQAAICFVAPPRRTGVPCTPSSSLLASVYLALATQVTLDFGVGSKPK